VSDQLALELPPEMLVTRRSKKRETQVRRYHEDPAYREQIKERSKARYHANREAVKKAAAEWARQHPERRRETVRRFHERHPDRSRTNRARRRALMRDAFVEHVEPLVVLERGDGVCGICGEDVDPFEFDVDHIVPLARGGLHNYENAQATHPSCNRAKQARLPAE
jgi:5-methylcytosine-specific restriction endonuclease McrA